MKVDEIVKGISSIQKLSSLDMPIGLALKTKRNIDKCQEVLDILELKRKEIVKKFDIPKDKDFPKEANDEFEKHLQEEVDIVLEPLSLKQFEENNIRLSSSDITLLSWMFNFDA